MKDRTARHSRSWSRIASVSWRASSVSSPGAATTSTAWPSTSASTRHDPRRAHHARQRSLVEQILKQVSKLIRVQKVRHMRRGPHRARAVRRHRAGRGPQGARGAGARDLAHRSARDRLFADRVHRRGHRHIAGNRSVLGVFAPARHSRHGALSADRYRAASSRNGERHRPPLGGVA